MELKEGMLLCSQAIFEGHRRFCNAPVTAAAANNVPILQIFDHRLSIE
jgi:hypothetical protein